MGSLAAISRDDVASAWRLLRGLPALLRRPLTVDEAHAALRARLERREERFVSFVQRAVFANEPSPYRALLKAAGCEAGDLQRLVRTEGIEGALHRLYLAGVYLTIDEFKGRVPAVRGSTVVHASPEQLYNPFVVDYLAVRSGGTRGKHTTVPVGLESLREVAVNQCLSVNARGGLGWAMAINGVPGGAATRVLLRHAVFGVSHARWFSPVDPAAEGLHPRYLWSARVMRWSARIAGTSIPSPEHVPPADPRPIVQWLAEVLRRGAIPHLRTAASSAVTICQAARGMGVGLAGVQFTLGGEPYTAARRAVVEGAGARGVPNYSTMEAGGPIAYGCLQPQMPDEMHFYRDTHAMIQPGGDGGPGGLPARALLLTVLFPHAPLVLINASAGDQVDVVERRCECPLEDLGWTGRFHTIRSFEKLTAGGMTFLDRDVIRVLEEVLPGRFGGGPTDYQLVESEDESGAPRLDLLVNPALGELDEAAIQRMFLDSVGAGHGAERVMSLALAGAGGLRVQRRPPQRTGAGKVFHLHRRPSP